MGNADGIKHPVVDSCCGVIVCSLGDKGITGKWSSWRNPLPSTRLGEVGESVNLMKYFVQCEVCGHRMRVLEEHIGRTGQCVKCGNPVSITNATISSSTSGPTTSTDSSALGQISGESHSIEWKPGEIILDLYQVLSVLGEGGMGKVYRVRHRNWGIDLAVKAPRPNLLARARGAETFERECETWINLGLHPHIVSCYYVRRIDQVPRIFAEYVEGGTLWQWILGKRFLNDDPLIALERILRVAIQISWGLHHAHLAGLIHRDVKPGNVLMTSEGNAKVTDFGLAIARELVGDTRTVPTASVQSSGGMTPMYCSPEQAARSQVTHRTDIWSFGLCLLQMFTRKVAWPSGPEAKKGLEYHLAHVAQSNQGFHMPEEIVQILSRCFEIEPQNRPETMQVIADQLIDIYKSYIGIPFPIQAPKVVEAVSHSLNNRAVSLLDLGKLPEALQLWQQALQSETQHVQSTFNLGLIRWRNGRISDDMLVKKMEEVSHLHPNDPTVACLLAQLHLERGSCVDVLTLLERLQPQALESEDLKSVQSLGQQYLKESRRLLFSYDAHADGVNAVLFHPDGEHVFTASEDNTIKMWNLVRRDCVKVFHGHTGSVDGLSLNTDGRVLLSMGRDRSLRIWNTSSGSQTDLLEGQRDGVQAASLSPNAGKILARGAENTAIIYDLEKNERTHTLQGHIDIITSVRWSPDMSHAYTASQDGTLRKWDLFKGACVQVFEGHQGPVTCLDVSSDGSFLISGGMDKSIRVWHTSTGQCLRALVGHKQIVRSVSVSRNNTTLISGGNDGSVRMWHLESAKCVRTFEQHQDEVRSVAISPDTATAVSVSRDRSLKHWQLATPLSGYSAPFALCRAQRSEAALSTEIHFTQAMERAREAIKTGNPQVAAKAVREARSQSGFARNPDAVRLWNRLYLNLPKTKLNGLWEGGRFTGHDGEVFSLALSQDGRWIASGGSDAAIRLWEAGTAKCVRTLTGHTAAVKSIALSPDGRFLISGGEDQCIFYWDMSTGEILRQFEGQMGSVECVSLSPDGQWALSGGWEFKLYEVAQGRPLRVFEGHSADVTAICWSTDGRYTMSASSDETVRMWDIATGSCLNVFQGPGGAFRTVAMSLNSGIAAGGTGHLFGRPGKIHIWDTTSGTRLMTLEEHTGAITALSFVSDGRFLVSSSSDSTIRIWDLQGPACIKSIQAHDGPAQSVAVSKDGRFAASAGTDGMLKSWILDWELGDIPDEDWDPAAGVLVEQFLNQHTPYAAELKPNVSPDLSALNVALSKKGKPVWNDNDFAAFCYTLGCAGMGWISQEVIRREIERAASRRTGITSIFRRMGR